MKTAPTIWILLFLSIFLGGCSRHERALYSKVQPLQYRLHQLVLQDYPVYLSIRSSSDAEKEREQWSESVEEARFLLNELEAVEGNSKSDLSQEISSYSQNAGEVITMMETIRAELSPELDRQERYRRTRSLEDEWQDTLESYERAESKLLWHLHTGEGAAFQSDLGEALSQLSEATSQSPELTEVVASLDELREQSIRSRMKEVPATYEELKTPIQEIDGSINALEAVEVPESLLNLKRDLVEHQRTRVLLLEELSKWNPEPGGASQLRAIDKNFGVLLRRTREFQEYAKSRFNENVHFFQPSND